MAPGGTSSLIYQQQVSMFVDVQHDDSYTPNKIGIRAGTHFGDMQDVKQISLDQPRGWQHFKLGSQADAASQEEVDWSDPEASVSVVQSN